MKAIFVFLLVTAIFISSAVAQQTIQQSQAEALRIFPDLGRKDSPLNQKFLALIQEEKTKNPTSLQDSGWPLRLARKAAESINQQLPVQHKMPEKITQRNQETADEVILSGEVQSIHESGLIVNSRRERNHVVADSSASNGSGGGVSGRSSTPKPTGLVSPSLKDNGGLGGRPTAPQAPLVPKKVYGNFLLTNHPNLSSMADGDKIEVVAKPELGTYKNGGSTYHIYSFVRSLK